MSFLIFSILILSTFYTIYFGKMVLQRKKGIKTNQMGLGNKEKSLVIQELTMKVVTILVLIVEVISIGFNWTMLHNNFRILGTVIGMIGVSIFFVSVYTMKDSWRAGITDEKTELVTSGIYKFSRNPAFLSFDLVYIGLLLMFFSYQLLIVTILAIISLHLQVIQEEQSLSSIFKDDYQEYKSKTFRYIGKRR